MLFKNYEYFLTIVEEGSVSKASRKLYISQPSLSQYLKRLEENLGVELFTRTSFPLKLTYAGERYLSHVKEIMRIDKIMEQELIDINSKRRISLRIGIAYWRGTIFLPEILPDFYQLWPNVDINITEGCANLILHALRNDKLDFAVMNITTMTDLSKLVCEEIVCEKILLVVQSDSETAAYLDAHSESGEYPVIDFNLLRNSYFILPKQGQNLYNVVIQLFHKYQFHPKIRVSVENTTSAINLASTGIGVCFIPEGGANCKYLLPNIKLYAFKDTETCWNLSMVYRKDYIKPPALIDFYNIAVKKFYSS